MKTVEIPLTSLRSFLKVFLGAAELLCVLIFCDYLLQVDKHRQILPIDKFTVFLL